MQQTNDRNPHSGTPSPSVLIKQGQILNDPWIRISAPLNDYREYPWFSIVPLEGLSDESQWPLVQTWIGVRFGVDVDVQRLTPQVLDLPLLNIEVETFTDGRVFSLARQLKTAMSFRGELRVSGHFLIDQMAQLRACGVDSFSLPADADLEHALFILKSTPEKTF